MKRIVTVRKLVRNRIVFTTSFGLEDQAITHAIFGQGLAIDVVTLDTGRLFAETYEIWAQTEGQYGRRIPAYYPDRIGLESLVASQGIHNLSERHAAKLDSQQPRPSRGASPIKAS